MLENYYTLNIAYNFSFGNKKIATPYRFLGVSGGMVATWGKECYIRDITEKQRNKTMKNEQQEAIVNEVILAINGIRKRYEDIIEPVFEGKYCGTREEICKIMGKLVENVRKAAISDCYSAIQRCNHYAELSIENQQKINDAILDFTDDSISHPQEATF